MSKEIERTREDKCIEVLEYMLEHMLPITKACNNSGIISFQEFYKELKINKNIREEYARACDIRSEHLFDSLKDIAENRIDSIEEKTGFDDIKGSWRETKKYDNTTRSKMIYDATLWQLTKMNPKKYGNQKQEDEKPKNVSISFKQVNNE